MRTSGILNRACIATWLGHCACWDTKPTNSHGPFGQHWTGLAGTHVNLVSPRETVQEQWSRSIWTNIFLRHIDHFLCVNQALHMRVPVRSSSAEFTSDAEAFYRQQYFEVLDHLMSSITQWFDQPDFRLYSNLELLLCSLRKHECEQHFTAVAEAYSEEFQLDQVRLHLQTLVASFPK